MAKGRASTARTPMVDVTDVDDLGELLRSEDTDVRERAWGALYEREFARVYRLVCRFGVDPGEVEDVTQRAFVVAFRRISEVERIRDPGAWLRAIAVRLVAEHRRWRSVRAAKSWLLRDLRVAAPAPVCTAPADTADQMENIRTVLLRLSVKLRDVLVLCDIEECTPTEVAQMLRIPVNTVRSRRGAARRKFAQLWRARFGDER